ncbi:hypothetical protein LPTSP3_g14880 [Leptospira kobayashii]|uniref:Uncharacterized protein n=1 Tax=Leptospira kobayashii TaxID=1917830 RepID=A0ABN6KFW0_9LEPT|nr:Vps62-related protein [Leptospira kobayashii]BDA78558.1 hypothetical protein LPTSP3_g14880 [Leptospira kobayashii]
MPATLKTSNTANYKWIYDDRGSGADHCGVFWRPVPTDSSWHILGDYVQRVSHYPSHGKPEPRTSIEIVKVEGEDDPDFPLLKEPVEYIQVWNDKDSGGDYNGAIWWPKPPDGYRSLGHVVTKGYDAPKTDIIRCVRRDYCRLGELNELTQIWSDRGSGAKKSVDTYRVKEMNTFYAQSNFDKPNGVFYVLKEALLVL